MIYQAKIIKIVDMLENEEEGAMHISFNNLILYVYFQVPYEFSKEYITIDKTIPVDLWLVYGEPKYSIVHEKYVPNNLKVAGGTLNGQVTKILPFHKFRIDCGPFEIDIFETDEFDWCIGDYIEVTGDYQVWFPGTEYSRENQWGF